MLQLRSYALAAAPPATVDYLAHAWRNIVFILILCAPPSLVSSDSFCLLFLSSSVEFARTLSEAPTTSQTKQSSKFRI